MNYRHDIDGLRAIAILPVVFYHADFLVASGGFIGVDVFFVISGFLITSIIAREIADDRFSLLAFYERRARRILPALMAVMIATFAVSWFVLLPSEMKSLGESALSVSLFLSNVYFLLKLDYFGLAAEFAPLLHTWSLAVEEQFYLFFPPLMMFLGWWKRLSAVWGIVVLSLLSLAAAIVILPYQPDWVFYLIFFRAWELGFGAIVALSTFNAPRHRLIREILALGALIAILLPAFVYTSTTSFPGLAAVPPVLGATLLIWIGSHNGGSFVTRLVGCKPLVWIGLISYSLYLWHWPILALMRVVLDTAELPTDFAILAVVASFALAWLSYRFVEAPFRVRPPKGMGQRTIFVLSAASLTAFVGVGGVLYLNQGAPGRLSASMQTLVTFSEDRNPRSSECTDWPPDGEPCIIGSTDAVKNTVTFLLWGDSHADAMMPGMDLAARQAGQTGVFLGDSGCPPLVNLQRFSNGRTCTADFSDRVISWLQERQDIQVIVMAARWALYVEGTRPEGETGTNVRLEWTGEQTQDVRAFDNAALVEHSLRETILRILAMNKQVVLVGPVPEIGRNVPTSLARAALFSLVSAPSLTRAAHDARISRAEEMLRGVADTSNDVHYISLSNLFCDAQSCRIRLENGMPIYFDGNHLSQTSAEALLPQGLQDIWSALR
jgi:peptidoglycan/LPS O-acetylase OafA/YrhL